MAALTPGSLLTLESYAKQRQEFRARAIAEKKKRSVQLGASIRLQFENAFTIQYQIQEMLRAEKMFEEAGIREELDAYNPLIPDGSNFKCTQMIEFPDPGERQKRLAELIGVEDKTYIQVAGYDPVFAIADEDMDRENADKTSSVHFLRFELEPAMITAVKAGADIAAGVDHPAYRARVDALSAETRTSLVKDLA